LEAGASAGREVDLLDRSLPDVPDVEVPRRTVEGEAPGVPEAERGDRPPRGVPRHVEAQQLAEGGAHVLRAILRVAARAAVAEARVERAAGPEDEVPSVVVRVRILDREQ